MCSVKQWCTPLVLRHREEMDKSRLTVTMLCRILSFPKGKLSRAHGFFKFALKYQPLALLTT